MNYCRPTGRYRGTSEYMERPLAIYIIAPDDVDAIPSVHLHRKREVRLQNDSFLFRHSLLLNSS